MNIQEENKRLVRHYIRHIINTGDVDRIGRFIAPDYIEIHNNTEHALGIEGARQHVLGVRQTYPDLLVQVVQQIAEGDWVVSRITACGTHLGEWLGIEPSGKRLEYNGVNIDRVIDGLIVEHGGAVNLLGPLLESGAVCPTHHENHLNTNEHQEDAVFATNGG